MSKSKSPKAIAARTYVLKSKYGLSDQKYEEMLSRQNGKCLICDQSETNGRSLAVDHDHKTGQNRGLLCGKCNQGLGMFQDNVAILRNAIYYLELDWSW